MKSLLFWLIKFILVISLPFVVLIRGSVYWHERLNIFPHLALAGGLALTFVVLLLYITFFFGRVSQKIGIRSGLKGKLAITGLLLGSYALYGLLYVSSSHVKSPEVQNEYRSLHPILRMGISALTFLDRDLLITDANRQPEDYRRWGLPVNTRSLHYRQSSGYAHAVDLRSKDRSKMRNMLVKLYFRMMGFNVLEHGGTEMHLHVSLMSHDNPYAM